MESIHDGYTTWNYSRKRSIGSEVYHRKPKKEASEVANEPLKDTNIFTGLEKLSITDPLK